MVNHSDESFIGHLGVAVADDRDAVRAALDRARHRAPTCTTRSPTTGSRSSRARVTRPPLPATERAAASVLSLPLFPELRDDEVDRVCAALEEL